MDENVCRHHWLIEPPTSGVKSRGRCKLCGEERDFTNFDSRFEYWRDKRGVQDFPLADGGLSEVIRI